eukprot:m.98724 g.98724  ORF g.98724 m.98724 type:complete len:54 (+) comp14880_c2_seq3:2752-2913(+)
MQQEWQVVLSFVEQPLLQQYHQLAIFSTLGVLKKLATVSKRQALRAPRSSFVG